MSAYSYTQTSNDPVLPIRIYITVRAPYDFSQGITSVSQSENPPFSCAVVGWCYDTVDKRHCVMLQHCRQTSFTSPNVSEDRVHALLAFLVTLFRNPIATMLSLCD